MSLAGARFLARRCPACRRREPGLRLLRGTWEGTPRHCSSDGWREGGCRAAETVKAVSTVAGRAGGPARSSCEAPAGRGGGGAKGPGHLWLCSFDQPGAWVPGGVWVGELKSSGKSFDISKWEVWEAYRKVKANGCAGCGRGVAGGVREGSEEQSVQDLESDVLGELLSASGAGGGDTEAAWRWDQNSWRAHRWPTGSRKQWWPRRLEGKVEPIFHPTPTATGRTGRRLDAVGGMPAAVLEDRLGDRFGYPEVLGCFVTLLFSLIVMVKTVLPGWLGAGYAGLFGVRCAGGRLAVRRA